ncbi:MULTISPECIES: UPF0182 family protein [Subtercola]|uniref:UPF0182 protein D4765_09175 n=1 Tax=Subtercola vilae TaxID=2056433 RepID=A0A4V4RF87_9MICO|nr:MULTISPECIES: UPF0182 family protein [Subtercola]MEA9985907.1 UPF0182 family protein [Subtercola sp. RTI3]TIH36904.1 UPF0182 family protein [Subtercola vilae]
MTSTTAQKPARRSRTVIAIAIAVIAVLAILFFVFTNLYTEVLWFDQLGFLSVLTTQWIAGLVMFFIGFFAMAIPVFASIEIAFRLRPVYAKLNSQLDRYQQVVEPLRRLAAFGIPAVLGLFAGVSSASRWQVALMYLNRTSFGRTDPQFNLDISFYVYDLPFWQGVVGFASAVVLIAGIAAVATSYLYGAIRFGQREVRVSKTARVQIAVIAGIYLLLQAVSIWLDQFATLSNSGGLITGASYADVNATIPGLQILAGIAIIVAVLFLLAAFIGRWRLPVIGTALLIVSGLVLGSLYPWVVQRFQVAPSERSLEAPYIQRNIDLTRDAYGVSNVDVIPYNATTTAEPGALRADAATTSNIRILDPALVSGTFAALQQFRQYYQFPKALNVDRYTIDGKTQDMVTSVRDLNLNQLGTSASWYNQTIVYTHGYGVVAAYGNQRSADGQPVFSESGIPSTGVLGDYEPRIYFGENSPDYSIVGAAAGTSPTELDYPSGTGGASQTYTTFSGDGGPKLDNVFNRLAYALKFQSEQIFLSEAVNSNSQILYDRDPATRVSKVAPYLTIDSDPYASVVDGHVVWIVDGYTTSSNYPYSKTEGLSAAIADTYTPKPGYAVDNNINYIRNSVKATVDAYDGKVTLYAWDATDPILQTWEKIFPATVKPMSDMSAQLIAHVRYPADLFKVQRAILGQYHVTDSGSFYSREDAWTTPNDPISTAANPTLQPPYYLTMQVPGQDQPEYSLYSTFIPLTGDDTSKSLNGYLAVDSNAGNTAGVKSADFGKLRLLTLPKDATVPGPGQVQNKFNADPTVSGALNLLKQGSTQVLSGNLLTLPVGGGLLYVQPVYVESRGETSYPLLQKILVGFGNKIAFEDTLDAALDDLFGGNSGATAGDSGTPTTTTPTTPSTGGTTTTPSGNNAALQKALSDAQTALTARTAALQAADWTAYGVADQQLKDAVAAAIAASGAQ